MGVLPVPPTVTLPTQITAAPISLPGPLAMRRAVAAAQIHDSGVSRARVTGEGAPDFTYHQRGVDSFMGQAR